MTHSHMTLLHKTLCHSKYYILLMNK